MDLAAEQGGGGEGWGLAGLARGGLVIDFSLDLKEICPSPLAPGGLGGGAASKVTRSLVCGIDGVIWRNLGNRTEHLRQKYKK